MTIQDLISAAFVVAGLFFLFVGGLGIVRFPDFYTRLHPAGKADTFGAALVVFGLIVYQGISLLALKLLLVEAFILLANPAAGHAIGRAAHRAGLPMWTGKEDRS